MLINFSLNINDLRKHYWFHDGSIKSFHLDITNNTAEIQLLIKRHITGKLRGQIHEGDLVPCTLKLIFEDLVEASLFDMFPTQGYYLEFNTYSEGSEEVGISFNVHDNSNHTYEKHNWVIKAKHVEWQEM